MTGLMSRPGRAVRGAAAALVALAAAAVAAAPASAGGCCANVYVHISTAADTAGDFTDFDLPSTYVSQTHGQPGAWVLVTPNWSPGGLWNQALVTHPVGVWYNSGAADWSVFNEDAASMPTNAAFNVYALGNPGAFAPNVLTVTATSSNSAFDYMDFSDPVSDGNPNATVFVTPSWNPGGNGGVFDPAPVGVWYNASTGHWSVFDEDLSAIPQGASFNVYVSQPGTAGTFVHTATSSDTGGPYTCPSYPGLDGNPNALVNVTQDWNPGNSSGVYDNSPLAVAWSGTRWCIANENGASMPIGASFNVMFMAQQLQQS